MKPMESPELLLEAAKNADWLQVVFNIFNGGAPCFHLETERGQFCLRSARWDGHWISGADHKYTSLEELLRSIIKTKQTVLLPAEWEFSCDRCKHQEEGKHYCLLHEMTMKNMEGFACGEWVDRDDPEV